MDAYKRATKRVVNSFLRREISFPECIHALDAALAKSIPRLKPEELSELRAWMFTNNGIVMKEMQLRESVRKTNLKMRLKAKRKQSTPGTQI
jgi:hypothetical protein